MRRVARVADVRHTCYACHQREADARLARTGRCVHAGRRRRARDQRREGEAGDGGDRSRSRSARLRNHHAHRDSRAAVQGRQARRRRIWRCCARRASRTSSATPEGNVMGLRRGTGGGPLDRDRRTSRHGLSRGHGREGEARRARACPRPASATTRGRSPCCSRSSARMDARRRFRRRATSCSSATSAKRAPATCAA